MKYTLLSATAAVLTVAALGCGPKTMVPPKIDLVQHEVIGIIEFRDSTQGKLGPTTTTKFIEAARRDQGTVRILELGTEAEALSSIGHDRLSPSAYEALGEKYEVSTVITGELVVSDIRPDITFIPGLDYMSFAAEVDATLTAKLVETATGASIWSGSASETERVGHVTFGGGTDFTFDAPNPEEAYGKLIDALVEEATKDFRVTWE
jgi:hypothetical protein